MSFFFLINTVVKNTACTDLFSKKAELTDKVGELVDTTATSTGRMTRGVLPGELPIGFGPLKSFHPPPSTLA